MKANKGGILILCDFDGTVCTVDMGNEVLNRFTDEGECGCLMLVLQELT